MYEGSFGVGSRDLTCRGQVSFFSGVPWAAVSKGS